MTPTEPVDRTAGARRGRRQALLILAVAAAPIVLGTWAFQTWEGGRTTNYGELLKPTPVQVEGTIAAGKAWRLSDSQGRWRIVTFDAGDCAEACQRKLLYMRQVRLALGRDQDRVARVWLTPSAGALSPEVEALLAEGQRVSLDSRGLPEPFGGIATAESHIYLVDPLGNLMMRYPSDPDPKRVIRDMQRLLKYSRTG